MFCNMVLKIFSVSLSFQKEGFLHIVFALESHIESSLKDTCNEWQGSTP